MYCDDLKAAFGGVGVSIEQAVRQAYGQHWKCKTDKKSSKCGYTAIVVDEYGYRSSFDASLQALTKNGLMCNPKYDQSEVFVDLGVPRVVL